jgi:hypothetical protein
MKVNKADLFDHSRQGSKNITGRQYLLSVLNFSYYFQKENWSRLSIYSVTQISKEYSGAR